MPDGDSLNWKVRGKGSRRVLSLVRSGAHSGIVADEALRMFVKQMNAGHWKPAICEMAEMLGTALKQIPPGADFAKRADVFDSFSKRVERLAAGASDDIRILVRAATNAFGSLEESNALPDADAVQRELLSNAARAVLDNRVLQPTRDEVAREWHRDTSEQICYERDLLSKVGEQGKRLQSAVFGDQDARPIRTPPRSVPQKDTTLERLGESLTVIALEER
jgi:hypothetical protein